MDFDPSLLYSLIHSDNNICIFYDLDLSDNITNNHEIMRNNAVIYYYKNNIPYVHSYISNSSNVEALMVDINNYVNEIISEIDNENNFAPTPRAFLQLSPYTSGSEVFEALYAGSFREEAKPYGYIDCNYVVRKYRANDTSSLYLVEAHFYFTPGKIARSLGDTTYADWYNLSGFAKIKAKRASNEVGINQVRYGGTPVFKDAYPINSPGVVSINSTYTAGLNLGYSFVNGFSTDNTSNNVSYTYNKSYQGPNPALSAQKDPNDTEKFTWLYTYESPSNETNHLKVGYMFEMNNYNHHLLEGDLALEFEYQMTVDNNGFWIFNEKYTFGNYTFHNYY